MKTLTLLTAMICVSACVLAAEMPRADAFTIGFKAEDIAYIAVGDDRNEPTLIETNELGEVMRQEALLREFFRITDQDVIRRLVNPLRTLHLQKPANITFSGVLSCQIFVGTNGQVLCAAHIICNGSSVVTSRGADIRDGKISFVWTPETERGPNGLSPEYCRAVYDQMRHNAPEEIKWRDENCRQTGQTLETLLFGSN